VGIHITVAVMLWLAASFVEPMRFAHGVAGPTTEAAGQLITGGSQRRYPARGPLQTCSTRATVR
ncbi:MAG TPA: hypothetical protein VGH85_22645, partial [Mycobacteriales bacterium]